MYIKAVMIKYSVIPDTNPVFNTQLYKELPISFTNIPMPKSYTEIPFA